MRSLIALLLLLLAASYVAASDSVSCGPPQCYTGGCTDARVQVDFVFFVDDSASMSSAIKGVRSGMTAFANAVSQIVDAQYSIVTFGIPSEDPRVVLNGDPSPSDVQTTLQDIHVTGYWEPGLSTMYAALALTKVDKLSISYRQYAKKVFILLTNEDSDPAYNKNNRYQDTACEYNLCKDSNLPGWYTTISPSDWDSQWQPEINDLVTALKSKQVSTYMMVNSNKEFLCGSSGYANCNGFYQYCDPGSAVQDDTFANFNAAETLANLNANGYGASIQGQMLAAGFFSRCFDVDDADNPDLVANFFQAITTDLGTCDPCYSYNCDSNQCQAPVYDKCGCDGKPTLPLATYDCAGVCGGNSKNDHCGTCTAGGVDSPTCVQDCDGNYYDSSSSAPTYVVDNCGQCGPVADPPFCRQDCNGNWNITTQDEFNALNNCTVDCNGDAGGLATYDNCGRCLEPGDQPSVTCLQDCNGDFYLSDTDAPYVSDASTCNVCVTAGQTGPRDNCSQCTNAAGYDSDSCTQDCKGRWLLANSPDRGLVDTCGDCWFPNQTDSFNSAMDLCGVCHGDNAGLHTDTQNNTCCFPLEDCSNITGPGITSCGECPSSSSCPGGFSKDSCGNCPTCVGYGRLDTCGMCYCTADQKNQYVDSCGICFGFDTEKLTTPCHTCNASDHSCYDCNGTPFGNATYDCNGVCGGTATDCAVCGDGSVQTGEECDDGSANGDSSSNCNSDCSLKTGKSQAAIIGGVIGAVAIVALLAAAAFLAFKYAVSKGLLGKASSTVDMGASNSNPLYKSETQVKTNPLYQSA